MASTWVHEYLCSPGDLRVRVRASTPPSTEVVVTCDTVVTSSKSTNFHSQDLCVVGPVSSSSNRISLSGR
jgi:hypothetical protein